MKKIVLLSAILFSAIVAEAKETKRNYHCEEINQKGKKQLTMDLYDLSEEGLQEGKNAKFEIEVLENDYISDGSVVYSGTLIARQHDVQVLMTDKKKQVHVGIYLDEDDQTWLKLGKKQYQFKCEAEIAE